MNTMSSPLTHLQFTQHALFIIYHVRGGRGLGLQITNLCKCSVRCVGHHNVYLSSMLIAHKVHTQEQDPLTKGKDTLQLQ